MEKYKHLVFIVTDEAIREIDKFLTKKNKDKLLRITIKHKIESKSKYYIECAESFSYKKDIFFAYKDICFIIDMANAHHINGCILHWEDHQRVRGLKFYRP